MVINMSKVNIMSKRACSAFLVLLLTFVTRINAAVVSDNDGSSFITKAEYDSLKNSFQAQLDSYNTNIDSKIDNAISSYIAGIDAKTESVRDIPRYVSEVSCMKYRGEEETKSLPYVHDWPFVSAVIVGWSWWRNYSGTYGWRFEYTPKKTETVKMGDAVGERNLIRNTIDKTSYFGGCAEWLGHINNVYEKQSWSMTDVDKVIYGWHFNNTTFRETGFTSSAPIYDVYVGGKNWRNGGAWYEPDDVYRNYNGMANLSNCYVSNIELVKGNNSKITNEKMIIWKPEKQIAFTETDKDRFWEFDANDISGWTESKTYAPILYLKNNKSGTTTNYKRVAGITVAQNIFSNSKGYHVYYQSNIGTGRSNTDTWNITSYTNWSSEASGDSVYEKNNKRYLYPVKGFPWKSIDNWDKLYISENDWAAKSFSTACLSVLSPDNRTFHLSLNAGWPIYSVKKDNVYKYKVSFKENSDHLVFGKLEPFDTSSPNTENVIEWDGKVKTDTVYNRAALVESGRTVELIFKAQQDGVFFIKWCDKSSSGSLDGGGTIKLSETITEIREG